MAGKNTSVKEDTPGVISENNPIVSMGSNGTTTRRGSDTNISSSSLQQQQQQENDPNVGNTTGSMAYNNSNTNSGNKTGNSTTGTTGTYRRKRCSSISPLPMREPIAPGIYTRIRKRSLTPLEVEALGLGAGAVGGYTSRKSTEEGEEGETGAFDAAAGPGSDESASILDKEGAYSLKSVGGGRGSVFMETDRYSLGRAPTIPDESGNTGLPIIQEFILDSQFSITIEGRKRSELKVFFYRVLCILTLGLIHLVSHWFPWLRSILTTQQAALANSSHIMVTNSYKQCDLVAVKRSYYGSTLKHVFQTQQVHEFLVLGEIPLEESIMGLHKEGGPVGAAKMNQVMDEKAEDNLLEGGGNSNGDGSGVTEEGGEVILYSHSCEPEYHSTPIDHDSVSDSSSLPPLKSPRKANEYLYYFEYRNIRFIYHPNTGRYFENSQWESFQFTDYPQLHQGLSQDICTQRQIIFGPNLIKITKRSIPQLLFDEILHPFNIFQLYSFLLWMSMDYYYYAVAIFVISFVTICININETQKNTDNIIRMARHECSLKVCRNGVWSVLRSDELVPGDLIEFSTTMTLVMPCDALLLEGDCIVNESMLTGESIPVSKTPISEDLWNKTDDNTPMTNSINLPRPLHSFALTSEKSLLHAGTRLVRVRNSQSTPAKAIVITTGFNTTKGLLMRNILFPRPISFKFYRDSMRFIGMLALIALVGFSFTIYNFIRLGVDVSMMFIRALDLITITIPPALPLSMSIGTSFAMRRLKLKNIFCISPPKINISGKLNLFCFDKTGTLTEEGLDILGLHYYHSGSSSTSFAPVITSLEPLNSEMLMALVDTPEKDLLGLGVNLLATLGMASCHSVKAVENELVGDPLDVKMFEFTRWELEDSGYLNGSSVATILRPPKEKKVHFAPSLRSTIHSNITEPEMAESDLANGAITIPNVELGIVKIFEFVPSLRRMSTLIKINPGSPGMVGFVKGAPESIREICLPASIPSDYQTLLDHYTVQGYRVIALATKIYPELSWAKSQKMTRTELESDLTFLAFLVFENRLKSVSKEVIVKLHKASFRTAIATGDNVLTAISVAKECRIIPEKSIVYIPKLLNLNNSSRDDDNSGGMVAATATNAIESEGELKISWVNIHDAGLTLSPTSLHPNHSLGSYTIACTGQILEYLIDHCSVDVLNRVLIQCNVYARMSPDQKQRLVECFQRLDYSVGFCGDGANDCGAMKAANVGLSLSEAEASVAAPFTCKVQDIRCTLDLVKEGQSALATSFSCFKFMVIYSLIQFTTVSILYIYTANLSDLEFTFIDLFLVLPIAICIGTLKSSNAITIKRPPGKLVSKKLLIPLLGQAVIQIAFQILLYFLTKNREGYEEITINLEEMVHKCELNTVLFTFSTFQYVTMAFLLCSNVPFQLPLYKTTEFMLTTIVVTLICLYFLIYPADWIMSILKLVDMGWTQKWYILLLAFINSVISIISYYWLFPGLLWLINHRLRHQKSSKKKVKLYKKLTAANSPTYEKV